MSKFKLGGIQIPSGAPDRHVARATKFCTVTFNTYLWVLIIELHVTIMASRIWRWLLDF